MHKPAIRRLFIDLEVSPNVVLSWSTGYKLSISYENIIRERAVICACWKWEGEKAVHSVEWDQGDDKGLLQKFVKVVEQADEVLGHNGDRFDLKWLRTRCLFHGIEVSPNIKSIDTLKLAKAGFRFNSNRLDYIAKFLGVGSKLHTDYALWKSITMDNDEESLRKMVRYCKNDVRILEQVYHKLESYGPYRTHAGVLAGGQKTSCVRCASENTQKRGQRVSAAGVRSQIMSCNDCGRHFSLSEAAAKGVQAASE